MAMTQAAPDPPPVAAVAGDGKPAESRAATERKVIHKAELTLSSQDVRAAADRITGLVQAAQGYVAQRNEEHADDHVVQSRLVLRVPVAS
jgi:Domain of unknown function (DUF4349)